MNGSEFMGEVYKTTRCGIGEEMMEAVVVQVRGKAHYTGIATFTLEEDDQFHAGFLPR